MLPAAPLLFSAALLFQPPAVGGGFDDPDLQPPLEDPASPTPGQFEADPFDDAPADPPEADPFDDSPAEPIDPPPVGEAMEGVERSVGEIAEDVEAEIDAFADPRDAPPAPLLDDPAPLPLDPADPDVIVVDDPAATIIVPPEDAPADPEIAAEPNPLMDLIRNPYDVYDLREHAAIPADCLLARQACLPCTRTVTACNACGAGTTASEVPVPGVNPMAAEQLGQILLNRTPNDPRVQYLMFVLRYRENRFDEAFGFLERAVRLEAADPIRGYSEFMEPIQGRSRVYLERVRNLAGVAG